MISLRSLKVSDRTLWICFFALSLIGLLAILSSTFNMELKAAGDPLVFVKRHLVAFLIGLAGMSFVMYFDYKFLKTLAIPLYIIMLVFLVLGEFVGVTAQGAQRWLSLGFISFQPSEISKLILIISLAAFFSTQKEKVNILPALFLAGIPFVLIFRQPDLGTSLVLVVIAVGMLIWSKASPTLLAMIFTPLLSLVLRGNLYVWIGYILILWLLLYLSRVKLWDMILILSINIGIGIAFPILWGMLKEYQRMRIVSFFNPGVDPQGMGYHTFQSKIAVGAGGLFGMGFMRGTQTQLQFIPIQHADFIFSAIAEEFGLWGGLLTLGLLGGILFRILKIAEEARDSFGSLLCCGIMLMFGFHIFVNIGMTLGLLPVVGIPLPFLSFGGTALVVDMICIGILQNVAMRRHKIIF